MKTKEILTSQYQASLEMLRQAIEHCPDALWQNPEYHNPFWHTAFHVIFYTHLYLHPTEADFVPWEKHRDELVSLDASQLEDENIEAYTKGEILEYLELCLAQLDQLLDSYDLDAASGFYWLPFNKLELQIYNIRHIMQHTGELYERLGGEGDTGLHWVGMKPAE